MAEYWPGLLDAATKGKDVVVRNMKQVGPAMKEVFGERIFPEKISGPTTTTATKAVAKGSPLAALVAGYEGVTELADAYDPRKVGPGVAELRAKFSTPEEKAKGKAYGESVANKAVGDAMVAVKSAEMPKKAAAAPEVEKQRQVVEAGAREKLQTNELSRSRAAEEVVKSDIQKTGQELPPEEYKARVAEEATAMKNMDNDQLAKYLSYALIAGGLIAGFTDDSGKAAELFIGNMNRAADRKQQMEMYTAEQKAKAEAAAAEAAIEREKLDLQGMDIKSKVEDRKAGNVIEAKKTEGILEKWQREAANAGAKLDAYRERTAAQAAKEGSSGKTMTAPTLSQKENMELVKTFQEAKGFDLDKGVLEAAASQLPNIQKNYPDLTVDEQMELIFEQFEQVPGEKGIFFDDAPTYKVR